ncbi:DHA2 family efflux MFS transporter permease subunit [Desulfolutivibrio sulfoxidireducens]|uniref:DHA2 family efflux MFS transporter permease subunit n=1 Tax=Desulfolutivibrio sulfoxidireducens TaxID=2773299 RepID=UPI00159D42D6|nr:DHA2 family efflux MFS transporter permease subunit [Desulfolutivibrio sulfoxidireducens]QLA15423.1 DHA2 family efflux MFS transporter permease subunit [Desulfolutivibrio sulfoxidireducens]
MEARPAGKWIVTLCVMIPTLIEILDTSIANVALGHIQGSLSAGQDEVTWVLTSYLVSNAVVIPISGWLSRLMGRRNYLLASIGLFTLSSMLCGMAMSLEALILFRVLQGVGGGGLQPVSQAILLETFPPNQRGMAMAIFAMGAVLGPILGPLLGGYITDHYSWRWIFYINVPIGLVALGMNWLYIQDPPYLLRRVRGEGIDVVGLSLLSVGLASLQIVLDKGQQDDWFAADHILALSVVAGVCLIFFVFWELRQKNPIVDLRIFRDRSFATGNVVMFFGFFAFFGSIVLLPMYLQNLMGYTAFLAGVVLGPGGLIMLLVLPLVGKLTQRVDARFLLFVGLLISAGSLWYMSGFTLGIDLGTAIFARNIQAVGIAFFFVPLSYLTMAFIPREAMNNASAIFNLLRNLGGSFGVAFVTTLLARRTQFHQVRIVENLSPFDPTYSMALERLRQAVALKIGEYADTATYAAGVIHRYMRREAAAMAFYDVFHAQALMFLALCVLMWIMRRPPRGGGMPAGH